MTARRYSTGTFGPHGLREPTAKPPTFRKGHYRVTRWCCTSGNCTECLACWNLDGRKRVVQSYGVSKQWAEFVVAGWTRYEATAELMEKTK